MTHHPIDDRIFREVIPFRMRKGDLRKIEIIEAAIDCIATDGLDKLTFESLGKRSKIGKSHVRYHFPTLDELVFNTIRYVYAHGQGVVADYIREETKAKNRLKAYINGTFHWMESHPQHAAVVVLLLYLSTSRSQYRKLQTELWATGSERVRAILELMPTNGDGTQPQRNLKQLSEAIHSHIVGNVFYFTSTDLGGDVSKRKQRTFTSVMKLIEH